MLAHSLEVSNYGKSEEQETPIYVASSPLRGEGRIESATVATTQTKLDGDARWRVTCA